MNDMRLIDANALKKVFNEFYGSVGHAAIASQFINDAPTVNAVEVCRCKDCKWGVRHSFYISYKCTHDAEYDEDLGGYVGFIKWQNADDFCSHGERKCDNDPS